MQVETAFYCTKCDILFAKKQETCKYCKREFSEEFDFVYVVKDPMKDPKTQFFFPKELPVEYFGIVTEFEKKEKKSGRNLKIKKEESTNAIEEENNNEETNKSKKYHSRIPEAILALVDGLDDKTESKTKNNDEEMPNVNSSQIKKEDELSSEKEGHSKKEEEFSSESNACSEDEEELLSENNCYSEDEEDISSNTEEESEKEENISSDSEEELEKEEEISIKKKVKIKSKESQKNKEIIYSYNQDFNTSKIREEVSSIVKKIEKACLRKKRNMNRLMTKRIYKNNNKKDKYFFQKYVNEEIFKDKTKYRKADFISACKLSKKSKIAPVEVVLAMIEATKNADKYNIYYKKGYEGFWREIKKDRYFSKIFAGFSVETLRKYYREISIYKEDRVNQYIKNNGKRLRKKNMTVWKIIQEIIHHLKI